MSNSKKNILLATTAAIISFVTVIISLLVLDYFSLFKNNEVENNDSVKAKRELVNDVLLIKLDSLLEQKEHYRELLKQEIAEREGMYGFGARAKYFEKIIANIDKEIESIVPIDITEKDTVPKKGADENVEPIEPIQNVIPNVRHRQNTTNPTNVERTMQNNDTTETPTTEPQITPTKDTTEIKTTEIEQESENQNDTQ
ncbi:MAG: hypothetical protein LBE91_06360 [Tannerella sp.]|jgi:hypothetical protein|nr:hypothetical protein [Tannerella sp.]